MPSFKELLKRLTPTILYFGLSIIILVFDFNIYIEGSETYPKFYIMPIIISIGLYIILLILVQLIKKRKELVKLDDKINFERTLYLFGFYMLVIWFPRQYMIWKFGVTFEKLPLLYLIVTQIIIVEGLVLNEFGLKKEKLLKNVVLGCLIALLDISVITIANIIVPMILEGTNAFSSIELFEIMQFITLAWQMLAVGVSEELFFRGYFFKKIRKSGKSFWYTTTLTSFVFMIFHIPWLINNDLTLNISIPYVISRVVNTFSFAFICCFLYEKTGSIVGPIVYHGLSNSLTTFIFLYVSPTSIFLYELLIAIIAFFNFIIIAFLSPRIIKLLKAEGEF
ncbi:MAG: CPBP family intramembrane metalloprotease [Candidatus Lokiarchaeota archaeon]|nr:CPBP family intramembrane metalloprotease [Candidatus Lokiarchaeota archaeon]MBD3199273.1 CPBP family intramembrane metalloprotease [Candidatus Lokiarchaeota archaeon]